MMRGVRMMGARRPGVVPPGLLPITNIVAIGASLTNYAFGQSLTTPHAAATALWSGVNVYGYGFVGDVASQTLTRLQAAFAAFPTSDTLFVVETGGNNVTATRPYATSTQAEKDALIADATAVLDLIATRPDRCVMSNISFREYADPATSSAMVIDGDAGSEPYNTNLFVPLIAARLPATMNADGQPILDAYNWSRNGCKTILGPDGLHFVDPAGRAAMRQFYRDRLAYFVSGGAVPAPIVPLSARAIDPSLPTPAYGSPAVIGFGLDPTTARLVWGSADAMITGGAIVPLTRMNGSDPGWTISCVPSVFDVTTNGVWRNIGGGRTTAATLYTGADLLCDEITTSSFYTGPGHTIAYQIAGLVPNARYKIDVTGSRNSTGPRLTRISFQSGAVVLDYEATNNPVLQMTGVVTASAAGVIAFVQSNPAGTAFSYLGGLRISAEVP